MQEAGEIFESWFKLQKEFMENWMKSQKEFMENWTEASRKWQESFLNLGGAKEGFAGKEMLGAYNAWLNKMMDSSRIFTDEATKLQETWKTSVEKQMEMSKEMFTNLSEFSKQGANKP